MSKVIAGFALFGAMVFSMALISETGVADFRLYFGPDAAAAGCAMDEQP